MWGAGNNLSAVTLWMMSNNPFSFVLVAPNVTSFKPEPGKKVWCVKSKGLEETLGFLMVLEHHSVDLRLWLRHFRQHGSQKSYYLANFLCAHAYIYVYFHIKELNWSYPAQG